MTKLLTWALPLLVMGGCIGITVGKTFTGIASLFEPGEGG